MNSKEILEGYLNEMQDAHKEISKAKFNLMSVALSPFEALFLEDTEGNIVAKNLKDNDKQQILDSFNDDLLPMFEEGKFQEGIEKVNEWKKIIEESLEKQK